VAEALEVAEGDKICSYYQIYIQNKKLYQNEKICFITSFFWCSPITKEITDAVRYS
jgi:hypothetical protein